VIRTILPPAAPLHSINTETDLLDWGSLGWLCRPQTTAALHLLRSFSLDKRCSDKLINPQEINQ